MTTDRTTTSGLKLERYLISLAILSLVSGFQFPLSIAGVTLNLTLTQIFILVIIFVKVVTTNPAHAMRNRRDKRLTMATVASALLLAIPALLTDDIVAGIGSYVNFLTGLILGLLVGLHWARLPRSRPNAIDFAFLFFVLASVFQLVSSSSQTTNSMEAHALVVTSWGSSNYVAGVLIIVSFGLAGRGRDLNKARWLFITVALIGIIAAIATLSRGAVIALGFGLLVFAWNLGRTPLQRFWTRTFSIASPLLAFFVYQRISSSRFSGTGADPTTNIEARFTLYRLALDEFFRSPIWGTGWTGLRALSEIVIGAEVSYAHNVLLSFLQIGGLLSLPFLMLLVVTSFRVIARATVMSSALAAAVGMSLIEPLYEGTVGICVVVSLSFFVLIRHGENEAERKIFATSSPSLSRASKI